jgi:hypothetical protein
MSYRYRYPELIDELGKLVPLGYTTTPLNCTTNLWCTREHWSGECIVA